MYELLAGRSQADAARGRRSVQERGADGVFELLELMGEDGFLTARCLAASLRSGCTGMRKCHRI